MNCDATFPDGKRAVLRAGTARAVCFSVCRYVWLERQIAMALAPPASTARGLFGGDG
jgi:hypothetical protein